MLNCHALLLNALFKYNIKSKQISQDININRQHTIHDPRQVFPQNIVLHINVLFFSIKSCSFVSSPVCASPWRSVVDVSGLSVIRALDGSHRPRLLISGARGPLSRLLPVVACVSGVWLVSGPFHAAVRLTCRYMWTSF